ncbi:SDR family NAD(P)-dependent oxidoreductase [Lentzea sp. NPDC058450]|uniref:SDR family NAD(P)-dependent oxidoreductase n=1 Tax=Lentzea sp. NPDC058450 TaxID=3346505 RepID=UPI00365ED5A6
MDLQLTGKRALVTGSSAGIGAAVAVALAREGMAVVVHGRDEVTANEVAESIRAEGGTVDVVLGDLSTDAGAARVAERVGAVDVLVNNAGVYETSDWDTPTTAHWTRAAETNVHSTVRMIQAFVPGMKERGWGRVIQMGSGTGHQPLPGYPQYGATKAALLNLTISLSRHLRGTGVTSNIVTPGLIRVGSLETMFRAISAENGWGDTWEEIEQGALRDFVPNDVGRIGTPDDVASIVALLASPLSRYVTGANWQVDGGSTAGI